MIQYYTFETHAPNGEPLRVEATDLTTFGYCASQLAKEGAAGAQIELSIFDGSHNIVLRLEGAVSFETLWAIFCGVKLKDATEVLDVFKEMIVADDSYLNPIPASHRYVRSSSPFDSTACIRYVFLNGGLMECGREKDDAVHGVQPADDGHPDSDDDAGQPDLFESTGNTDIDPARERKDR